MNVTTSDPPKLPYQIRESDRTWTVVACPRCGFVGQLGLADINMQAGTATCRTCPQALALAEKIKSAITAEGR